MANTLLNAEVRNDASKGQRKDLRKKGYIPGVLYGESREPIGITLAQKELEQVLHQRGGKGLLTLKINDDKKVTETPVMVKEVQTHPVKGVVIHIDLHQVNLRQRLEVEVPVQLTGDAEGVKEGGMLQQHMRTITLKCLPTDIPESISYDISQLKIGDQLTVSQLIIPNSSEMISDPEQMVANIIPPRIEEEEAAPEELQETQEEKAEAQQAEDADMDADKEE